MLVKVPSPLILSESFPTSCSEAFALSWFEYFLFSFSESFRLKNRINWGQRPDMTIAVDWNFKLQFKQTDKRHQPA